ncbi:hypothetical protein THAOC_10008 [Thalassiosira oceanica]|uniref:Glycosyltransferase 61 catalytic domain-containing protein n=1 Tax=Thalassiosira oceanica TaxID=159749 RepID=K0SV15_THAOC|nr:hypothetical protein THAOC_10008 [Thalassiosira oceanica]|eukprot:EJK68779.1 hypothetical protein THAOC_10008 [Thalassiosira oceanica]
MNKTTIRINRDHPLKQENVNITEADLFKSACLSKGRNSWHHISYKEVFGSWDFKTLNRSADESINKGSNFPAFLTATRRLNEDTEVTNFSHFSGRGQHDYETSPIMLVPPIPNPAHCVQDLLFSILPMAYRRELKGVHAVSIHSPGQDKDYCVQAISALGWFEGRHTFPAGTICFEKLWAPAFMHYRFPRGRSRGLKLSKKRHGRYLHKEDLPIEMLKFLQSEMWRAALDDADGTEVVSRKIVLESRRGLSRRTWKNVDDIANILKDRLSLNSSELHIVGNVGDFSWKQQAALFHGASIWVTPHSGSNPNTIFMKPNTTVIELSCKGTNSWIREWIVDLDIDHRSIVADDPMCSGHDEKFLGFRPETLVDPIVKAYLEQR